MADRLHQISLRVEGGVAVVTFERPGQYNAMNGALMSELIATLEDLSASASVRVIVITGSGKAFMSGADIKEYASHDAEGFRRFQLTGRRIYDLIESAPQPVIAAVNGYALGGGFEIVLACDLVVAARGAKCGLPEIGLNLVPGGGGTHRAVARLGANRAAHLLLSGEIVETDLLRDWGLVTRLTDRDSVLDEALELARSIADRDPAAVRALKRLIALSSRRIDAHHYDAELDALAALYHGEAAQAKIAEFVKRSEERKKR